MLNLLKKGKKMIIGIGTDLTNIERIQKILNRHGDKFSKRIFSEFEQKKVLTNINLAESFAKRWAAKEACAKALGTGLQMGISLKEMIVSNLDSGQPTITLDGAAQKRLNQLTPVGEKANIHISITDDHPWAQAMVIIESQPIKD